MKGLPTEEQIATGIAQDGKILYLVEVRQIEKHTGRPVPFNVGPLFSREFGISPYAYDDWDRTKILVLLSSRDLNEFAKLARDGNEVGRYRKEIKATVVDANAAATFIVTAAHPNTQLLKDFFPFP